MAAVTKTKAQIRKGRPVTPTTKAASSGDVLSRVTKPGTVKNLKGVLFGPPKTGKTYAATNTSGKTLLILTEPEGDLAIRHRSNVDVFRPESWKDLHEVTVAGKGRDHGYETFVYDSVTFMFELVAGKEVAETHMNGKDIRRPYGKGGSAVNQIIYNAMALPLNVIFTAQMKVDGGDEDATPLDPTEGEHPLTLHVTPMVFGILTPAVSFLGRTYKQAAYEDVKEGNKTLKKKVVQYWTSFEDHGRSPAGDRLGLPDQVRDLNLDDLLAAIKEGG